MVKLPIAGFGEDRTTNQCYKFFLSKSLLPSLTSFFTGRLGWDLNSDQGLLSHCCSTLLFHWNTFNYKQLIKFIIGRSPGSGFAAAAFLLEVPLRRRCLRNLRGPGSVPGATSLRRPRSWSRQSWNCPEFVFMVAVSCRSLWLKNARPVRTSLDLRVYVWLQWASGQWYLRTPLALVYWAWVILVRVLFEWPDST